MWRLVKSVCWHIGETFRWYIRCRHVCWEDENEPDGWPSGWRHCRRCGFTQQLFYDERNMPRPAKKGEGGQ